MIPRYRSRVMATATVGSLSMPAWGHGGGYRYGSGMMYGGGGIFGWLMMVLVVVLIVAVVIGVMRWIFPGGHRPPPSSRAPQKSALEILEERFARGEIDKDEFEEKRKTLSR